MFYFRNKKINFIVYTLITKGLQLWSNILHHNIGTFEGDKKEMIVNQDQSLKLHVYTRSTGGSIMETILIIVHWTKPIFYLGQDFDESNPNMNSEEIGVHKCKSRGCSHFCGHLDYGSSDKTQVRTCARV